MIYSTGNAKNQGCNSRKPQKRKMKIVYLKVLNSLRPWYTRAEASDRPPLREVCLQDPEPSISV